MPSAPVFLFALASDLKMWQSEENDSARKGCQNNRLHRIVLCGCVVMGLILLSVLVLFSVRGLQQKARVTELLQHFDEASILAQYGEYRYQPPPTMRATYDGGEFEIVLGRGQRPFGFEVADDVPPYVEWIIPLFGEHCVTHVTDVKIWQIFGKTFTDNDVPLLLAFPDLKVLDVSDTAVTDAGLARLASLKGLVRIDVSGTSVSEESLHLLSRCRNLKELDISDTNADKQVVDYLKDALPECWIIDSVDTNDEQ